MLRIDDRTVVLTDTEVEANSFFNDCLDHGFGIIEATVATMDSKPALDPEFYGWLADDIKPSKLRLEAIKWFHGNGMNLKAAAGEVSKFGLPTQREENGTYCHCSDPECNRLGETLV